MTTKPTPGPWRLGTYTKMGDARFIEIAPHLYIHAADKETAAFIVAACNACQAINPDNPIAVAEALPEVVDMLRMLVADVNNGSLLVNPEDRRATEDDLQRAMAAIARLNAKGGE